MEFINIILISNGLERQKLYCYQFCDFKGATKLYFVHYLRVVMILFSTDLCKSVYSTCYFIKPGFVSLCFDFSCFYISGF